MNLSVMDISLTKKRNTIAANVTINCHSEKGRDCYILHAVLLAIMLLLLITVISYHIEKHRSNKKLLIRPVKEWHVIALAHIHTHQYLFRHTIIASVLSCPFANNSFATS